MRLLSAVMFACAAQVAAGQDECRFMRSGEVFSRRSLHQFESRIVADEVRRLGVYDCAVPERPVLVGALVLPRPLASGAVIAERSEGLPGLMLVRFDDNSQGLVTGAESTTPVLASTGSWTTCETLLGRTAIAEVCSDGVQLIDIRDPASPVIAARITGQTGPANTSGMVGPYLFWRRATGCDLYDVSDPHAPVLLGSLASRVRNPRLRGSTVFCDYGTTVATISLAAPTQPRVMWSVEAAGFSLAGRDLYVSSRSTTPYPTVRHFDVAAPESPTLVSTRAGTAGVAAFPEFVMDNSGPMDAVPDQSPVPVGPVLPIAARGSCVVDQRLYIAAGTAGLLIYDISTIEHPVLLGSYDTPDIATRVQVVGDMAYIADRNGGLLVVNIADPARPTLAARRNLEPVTDVKVAGDRLAATTGNSIRLYRLASPADPVAGATVSGRSAVVLDDRTAWIAGGASSLRYDIADVAAPRISGSIPDLSESMVAQGDWLVVNSPGVLKWYHRAEAIFSHQHVIGGNTFGLVGDGDRVWVQSSQLIYGALNVPGDIGVCGTVQAAGTPSHVAAGDGLLVVSMAGAGGMQLYRLPASTGHRHFAGLHAASFSHALSRGACVGIAEQSVEVSTLRPDGGFGVASNLRLPATPVSTRALEGSRFLANCYPDGIVTVSAANPSAPRVLAVHPTPEYTDIVDAEGGLVIGRTATEFVAYEVSDSGVLTEQGRLSAPSMVPSTGKLSGGVLVFISGFSQLNIADFRRPTAPSLGGSVALEFWDGISLAFDGRWCYASLRNELRVIDIADPANPVTTARIPVANVGSMFFHGDRLICSAIPFGGPISHEFDLNNPAMPELLGPWNSEVIGRISGPQEGVVAVVSVDGRLNLVDAPGPWITRQPRSVDGCLGQAMEFTCAASAGASYQWRRDREPIPGATAPVLRFDRVRPMDFAMYDCLVMDGSGCGGVTSDAAFIRGCAVDIACDGMIDWFDYTEYLGLFEAASPDADFNGDEFIDFFDYADFVAGFETGC